nr:RNA-directed DNA polymerase, eukaryota [Tanacetum cinerariifolium]
TRSQSGIVKPIDRLSLHTTFISPLPKSPLLALQNPHWNNSMHDEYNPLVKNDTWILVPRPADRYKIQANIARFQRPAAKKDGDGGKKTFTFPVPKEQLKSKVIPGVGNSYMGALKSGNRVEAEDTKSKPSIVLGDECVNDNNLSNALLGRVKEFASLANLKLALGNEGFGDIRLRKLLDVDDQEETCFHLKRLCIHMKSVKSINEEFKILYRGKTYWIRANETPDWVLDFNEEADDEDETNSMKREGDGHKFDGMDENSDDEEVHDTMFEDEELVRNSVVGDPLVKKGDNSEDPFNIYSLLNRNNPLEKNVKVSDDSLKYPPGYTPFDGTNEKTDSDVVDRVQKCEDLKIGNKEEVNDAYSDCRDYNNSKETKMENMKDFCVRQCWGNLAFDHVHSDAVKNSGGTLCVWDPNSFSKSNVTVSDYFVISRGHWRLTDQKMMIIAVYAPQESKEKQNLWDYLQQEIGKWKGERGNTWKGSPCVGSNAMSMLMSKLRFLKNQIRDWNKSNMVSRKNVKAKCKKELEAVDMIIDNGNVTEEVMNNRSEIIQQLQKCDKIDFMEMVQKAKTEECKKEFFDHLSSRFSNPGKPSATIQLEFSNQITLDQRNDLERDVTNDEIKKAVWDCRTDKASGPDGFTFGLFRHFWYLVEREIYDAVRVVDAGMFHGINLGGLVNLSHMFYADDAVFVGEWSERNITTLVHVLECFHKASGLKINMRKSKIMGFHVESGRVVRAADKLGCLVLKTPFLYLGSLVGGDIIAYRTKRRVEQLQMKELTVAMQSVILTSIRDRWVWSLNGSGEYSVSSVRNLIDSTLLPKGDNKTKWIRYVSIKVNTLAWKVMTNSLSTRFNISRCGIEIDSISCVNCRLGVETTNHLFFTCDLAKQISRLIARWWDVPCIEIDSYGNWLAWMRNIRMPVKNKNMLEGVFFVKWWLLWTFRNKKIF